MRSGQSFLDSIHSNILRPNQQKPLNSCVTQIFLFRYTSPRTGYITTLKPPQRRDYAVFLFFEQIGSHKRTEMAITGSALPVLLNITPNKMDFDHCEIGQKKEMTAVIQNDSELKSIRFKFQKVANFVVQPSCGRVGPKSCKTVTVSFVPHQIGLFVVVVVVFYACYYSTVSILIDWNLQVTSKPF